MRKHFLRLAALIMSALLFAALPGDIFPALAVGAAAASQKWDSTYSFNGKTSFSVTKKVYHEEDSYSVCIKNTDYNVAYVTKTYSVKPSTDYVFSAWVRYAGYKISSAYKDKESGALLARMDNSSVAAYSPFHADKEWKYMSVFFTTGKNQKTVDFALFNGMFGADCKGTAYFSGVSLRKANPGVWEDMYSCFGTTIFTADKTVRYDSEKYSIKLRNTDNDVSYVTKTYPVSPGAEYTFSAMVKYSGYKINSAYSDKKSGACLALTEDGSVAKVSDYYTGSGWKKLTLSFTAQQDQDKITIALYNGMFGADCTGTAYFGGLSLRKNNAKEWNSGLDIYKVSEASTDSSVKYSGDYSIKLENKDYNLSSVHKVYSVKPGTRYRFSAMVKYSGYKLKSGSALKYSGASLGYAGAGSESETSGFSTSEKWTRLSFEFLTGKDQKTVDLALFNGMYAADCRGTAWFSDIKLEKAKVTNEWDMLAVIFTNVDSYETINGKSVHVTGRISDKEVSYVKQAANNLPATLKELSGGLMSVKNLDIAVSDAKIDGLIPYSEVSISLDGNSPSVSKVLDKLIAGKHYNQIIAVVRIGDVSGGFGAGMYKGINFCQDIFPPSGKLSDSDEYPEATMVHEFLHCLERESKLINPDKTAVLHNYADYGFKRDADGEFRSWHRAYMRSSLKDGMGLDPAVYKVSSGKYTVISDDMSIGAGFAA